MLKKIINKIIFRKKLKLWEEALVEERKPLNKLKEQQWIKFKKLLTHAYTNVPFYKKKFDQAGITPEDIKEYTDIKKIPITTKEELIAGFPDEVKASNLPDSRFSLNMTSGSSGVTLSYYNDTLYQNEERKGTFRLHAAIGLKLGDKIVRLRNVHIKVEGWLNKLRKVMSYTKYLDTIGMSEKNMGLYVEKIKKYKPVMIESFSHHILALADYMDRNNITLNVNKILIVGGSIFEDQKAKLERLFSAKIYNEYGASECMRIAYQCEYCSNFHLDITRYFVEILNKGKDAEIGQAGEIVLTNLYNYSMPFIRYRIKDVAVVGDKCACDRNFPVVKEIKGRIQQIIILPNGRLLDPNMLRRKIVLEAEKISQFQIVFTKENELEIRIIPKDNFSIQTEKNIINNVNPLTDNSINIKIVKVSSIQLYGNESKDMFTLTQIAPNLTEVV